MSVLGLPSPGRITDAFGIRPKPTPTSPGSHYGTDRGWGNGDEIYAMADGVVTSTAPSGAYGNRTVLDHGRLIAGKRTETWYCHQSRILVPRGSLVTRGQLIGYQGATGNVTAKHLHTELRLDGVAVDETPYQTTASTAALNQEELEMPINDDDAQTVVKTKIILPAPWGVATLAETVAGTRARAEQILESNNRLETKVDRLLAALERQ